MRLHQRKAIVTGGGSGLGLAIALRMAEEGAAIAVLDIAGADEAAARIAERGGRAIGIATDIASEASVAAAVGQVVREFGAIDILVNNAAIASTVQPTPFEQTATEDWRRILEVNVIGTFLMCRAVAPVMRRNAHGRIINFSSGTALRGAPMVLPYVASKGAISAMSLALANELGKDGITVNTIAPGYILTEANLANAQMGEAMREMTRARRAIPRDGMPEDVVGAVIFLASDEAAFISSQTIVVNGGPP